MVVARGNNFEAQSVAEGGLRFRFRKKQLFGFRLGLRATDVRNPRDPRLVFEFGTGAFQARLGRGSPMTLMGNAFTGESGPHRPVRGVWLDTDVSGVLKEGAAHHASSRSILLKDRLKASNR